MIYFISDTPEQSMEQIIKTKVYVKHLNVHDKTAQYVDAALAHIGSEKICADISFVPGLVNVGEHLIITIEKVK